MRESWVRSILNQCQVSATPFFFKQWGEWAPTDHSPTVTDVMNRVGKTAAGRQLNGRTWDETP
jgi:protein gp37